jgi:hypothetical protein
MGWVLSLEKAEGSTQRRTGLNLAPPAKHAHENTHAQGSSTTPESIQTAGDLEQNSRELLLGSRGGGTHRAAVEVAAGTTEVCGGALQQLRVLQPRRDGVTRAAELLPDITRHTRGW